MTLHRVILLLLAAMVPLSLILGLATNWPFFLGFFWGGIALSTLYLIAVEIITHREVPGRGVAMLIAWGSILGWIVIGEIYHPKF